MLFFKPIINMMSNLKEGQKFSFIGLVLGIPIIVLTLFFIIKLNSEISWKEEKINGAYYNQQLKNILQEVQQQRIYMINNFVDDYKIRYEIEDKQFEISQYLNTVRKYDKKYGQSSHVTQMITQLEEQWNEIQIKTLYTPQQVTVIYNEFIENILNLLELVASEYRLILATDEYSYYLNKDVTQTLPMLIEHFGQIYSLGISIKSDRKEYEIRQMNSLIASSKQLLKDLESSRNKKMRTSKYVGIIDKHSVRAIEDSYQYLNYVESQFINVHIDKDDLFEKFIYYSKKTINACFNVYDAKTNVSEQMMNEQLKRLKQTRVLMFSFQIITAILTIYCFVGFYFSMRNTIRKVREESFLFGYRFLFPQLKKAENKYEQTQQRLNEVERTMSQKVMQAHEGERKRVSRELHDSIGQYLYSILVKLTVIEKDVKTKETKNSLYTIKHITEQAIKETKEIAQSLRPGILDDLGLIPALKSYIRNYMKIYNINVTFQYDSNKTRLSSKIETNLYRIAQEALTNIAKHSNANKVTITIKVQQNEKLLQIEDNGMGFDLINYLTDDNKCKGIGLFSMKERTELLGGTFNISSKKGNGTIINVNIPKGS